MQSVSDLSVRFISIRSREHNFTVRLEGCSSEIGPGVNVEEPNKDRFLTQTNLTTFPNCYPT